MNVIIRSAKSTVLAQRTLRLASGEPVTVALGRASSGRRVVVIREALLKTAPNTARLLIVNDLPGAALDVAADGLPLVRGLGYGVASNPRSYPAFGPAVLSARRGATALGQATATLAAGSASLVAVLPRATGTLATVVVLPVAADPPVATVAPSISVGGGTAQTGATLTCAPGTWTGAGAPTFQWLRDGTPIAAATAATYILSGASDAGHRIDCRVSATGPGGTVRALATGAVTLPDLPVATNLPAISYVNGGLQLRCGSVTADWTGSPTLTFAWKRENVATGITTQNYTLAAAGADEGKTFTCTVSATNRSGTGTASKDFTVGVTPAASVAPAITGTAQDGRLLTASNGTWAPTPDHFTYQWLRDNVAIPNATLGTYLPGANDVGSVIKVTVTATIDGVPTTGTATSTGTAKIAPRYTDGTPTAPTGTLRDDQQLDASASVDANTAWNGVAGLTLGYRWRRCNEIGAACADIAGATASTYTLTAADVGQKVRVFVSASKNGSAATDSIGSTATGVIAPRPTAKPTITGASTAIDGTQLTASDPDSDWNSPPNVTLDRTYDWRSCAAAATAFTSCDPIAGASTTSGNLTPGAGEVGLAIKVQVTATANGASTLSTFASDGSASVAPIWTDGTPAAPAVQGGGALDANATLVAPATLSSATSWHGVTGLTVDLQWQRCDEHGASCADIGGETGSTYTLTSADAGQTLRVGAAASKGGSAASAATPSATTAVVAPGIDEVPDLNGSALVGRTITPSAGTWVSDIAVTTGGVELWGCPSTTTTYDAGTCTQRTLTMGSYRLVDQDGADGVNFFAVQTASVNGASTTAVSALRQAAPGLADQQHAALDQRHARRRLHAHGRPGRLARHERRRLHVRLPVAALRRRPAPELPGHRRLPRTAPTTPSRPTTSARSCASG